MKDLASGNQFISPQRGTPRFAAFRRARGSLFHACEAWGVFIFAVIFFLMQLAVEGKEQSTVRPPEDLWKGIIGEAVSEGRTGMTAVAFVYRNRIKKGIPLGCVALQRKDLDVFVRKQGGGYARIAKKIIKQVFVAGNITDPTNGATHYENLSAFGRPRWAKNMVITARIGKHTFFREK
ncbi:MAG: cell wall hydrolase [Clostridia bacterium]|jgi:hypothetical protein